RSAIKLENSVTAVYSPSVGENARRKVFLCYSFPSVQDKERLSRVSPVIEYPTARLIKVTISGRRESDTTPCRETFSVTPTRSALDSPLATRAARSTKITCTFPPLLQLSAK